MYTYANVQGIKHTSSEYILILNPDCIGQQENWLKSLVDYYTAATDIGVLGAILQDKNGLINHAGAKNWGDHIGLDEKNIGQYNSLREVPWVTGALHFFKRSIYEAVGGHQLKYRHIESDRELCLDMKRKLNLKTYCAPILFTHYWGQGCR